MREVHDKLRTLILQVIDFFYPPFRKFLPMQTFRYAACGGINMLFDILLYFISYNYILQKQMIEPVPGIYISAHVAALFISFIFSFPTGFYLSRYVVWQQTETKKRVQMFRYLLVVIACMLLNYVFIKLFVEVCGLYPTIAKVLTSVVVVTFSYFTQRNFSFKKKVLA